MTHPSLGLLLELAGRFALISLFAVGGGITILVPQMQYELVQQKHWLDDRTFAQLFAVAQAAPGPNFLLVPLIGWHVAAWQGALVSLVAFVTPAALIAFVVGRALNRHQSPLIVRIRRSFRPVTGGLWIAAGLVIAHTTDHSLVPLLVTAGVALLALFVDASPLWWCIGAGLLGALFG